MEQSFLSYAMSVITTRALPDARDGLKPVHRRILWSMFDSGLRPDRPHKKSATVVGDVIANYHPHGDGAIYDALVRMAQPFSLGHPLIDGHGNFGSPSDPPAAYRYTECKLESLAMHMVADIDQDTVDFAPNFNAERDEPEVLPSRFPNLLVNGSQGIAVGMATNIPPHNLGEVIDATKHLIDNPESTVEDLMQFVHGPDFPTGGLIMGRSGIHQAFTTGRGSVRIRARAEIVEGRTSDQIVVTEIPYQQSVENIETKIAEAVDRKVIDGIRALRNESAKGKTRFVIELKRDAPALVVLNNLYKHSPLQSSFAVNTVALVDGVPRTLDLRAALVAYVAHQVEVLTRRTEYRLRQARDRSHIVEGLLKALDLIDEIIATIRASDDRAGALAALQVQPFEFSERQANHILDMQLGRLTRLGRTQLQDELQKLAAAIAELEAILGDDQLLRSVIKDELDEIRSAHSIERRSEITFDPGNMEDEDLIDDEPLVVTLSDRGYIKTVSIDAFRTQSRGGRGVQGARLKDEDVLTHVVTTTAHAYLLFFSNKGKVYRLKAHQIPMMERTARGTAVVNLLQLDPDEHLQAIIDTRDYETHKHLLFATRNGVVKKTLLTEYDKSRADGLIAVNLRDGDELVSVVRTTGTDDIFMVASTGQTIRFAESDVRAMGRAAAGVRGMKLRNGDFVVACDVGREGVSLVIVADDGNGKRTLLDKYPRKGRGTMGVRGMRLRGPEVRVVAAHMIEDEDEIVLVASGGTLIKTRVSDISLQGRDASGVRVMNVPAGEVVAAVAPSPAGDHDLAEDDDEAVQADESAMPEGD
ncbi:MAG: DNA gyrase subunit A [Actinomycetia bacterium]|nr:DNA gyrase subunit A [Actinomycetes bacterium]MCP4960827.1 DNA gyrase subunit A [Actinomycetes bacterium]